MNNSSRLNAAAAYEARLSSTAVILAGLLVLQLVLAAVLHLCSTRYVPAEAKAALLKIDWDSTDKLVITEGDESGKEGKSVCLQKKEKKWVLPDEYDFPVRADLIEEFLSTLKSAKAGTPVAVTAAAADRFKVGDKSFLKRLQIYKGGQLQGTIYFGTSPAFRTMYARAAGSNDIFAVDVAGYDVRSKADEWRDLNLPAVPETKVAVLDVGTYRVKRQGPDWFLSRAGKDQKIAATAAFAQLEPLSRLSANAVLGVKEDTSYGMNRPVYQCSIKLTDGTQITYKFSKPADKDYVVLKMSNQPFYLKLDSKNLDRLMQINAETILKQDAEAKKQEEAISRRKTK